MKIQKTTRSLILVSIVAIVFNLARLEVWGTTNLLFLNWNLCLAWIPYIVSFYFINKETKIGLFVPLFIIWLLFFPNAPYLVTDVLHLVSGSPVLWYDSLLLFFFGWIGLFLGILSLINIHQYFKVHMNFFFSEISVLVTCLVSSIGVYIGRFNRWNSWDVFSNPIKLLRHSSDYSTNLVHTDHPIIFVVIFTIFLYSVYKTVATFLE